MGGWAIPPIDQQFWLCLLLGVLVQDGSDNLLKKLHFVEFNDINLFDVDCKKTILLHELHFVSPKENVWLENYIEVTSEKWILKECIAIHFL